MTDPRLPSIHVDDALDHCSDSGVGRPREWWSALHSALIDPAALHASQRVLLSPDLVRALDDGSDDDIVEAWLDDPSICDQIWTMGLHCPADRELLAHLVLAASQGAPEPIAELLCRDLARMAALDLPEWGGPFAALERAEQASGLADRLDVLVTPFRDLYDVMHGPNPRLTIDAVCVRGARSGRRAIGRAIGRARPGDLLVIDAGDLYDRQIVRVTGSEGTRVEGVELVSGARCSLYPGEGRWTLTATFDRAVAEQA